MFNLNKFAKSEIKIHEKMLEDNRKSNNTTDSDKETKILAKSLESEHKETDKNATLGKLLSVDNKEDDDVETIEALIDEQDLSDEYPQRTEEDKYDVTPINLLSEALDQERYKKLESTDNTKKESSVEKDVNSQLDEEVTKQPLQPTNTQLQNHWTRFKGITPEKVKKNPKLKQMVLASLSDVDAMTYYIYRTAFSQNREISSNEEKTLDMIRDDRNKILNLLK